MRVWTAYACVDCLCVCVLCVPRVREYGLVREDQPHPEGNLAYVRMCIFTFFFAEYEAFRFRSRVFHRALGMRGMQGTRLYTTLQVWVPGGLRGACSGRSKSRNLASHHGIAFRRARADQANGNPPNAFRLFFVLCCCVPVFATSTTPALRRCML